MLPARFDSLSSGTLQGALTRGPNMPSRWRGPLVAHAPRQDLLRMSVICVAGYSRTGSATGSPRVCFVGGSGSLLGLPAWQSYCLCALTGNGQNNDWVLIRRHVWLCSSSSVGAVQRLHWQACWGLTGGQGKGDQTGPGAPPRVCLLIYTQSLMCQVSVWNVLALVSFRFGAWRLCVDVTCWSANYVAPLPVSMRCYQGAGLPLAVAMSFSM